MGALAMPKEASFELTIPFHDVDAMGVVWHGHYLKYFEHARTKLLQSFHYDYPAMRDSGYIWPIIECKCRYIKPITYGMTITIHAKVTEYEHRLKIDYVIRNEENKRLTKGHTIQVAVEHDTQVMCLVSPQVLLDKLGVTR